MTDSFPRTCSFLVSAQERNQRKRHREGAVCRTPARQSRPSLCTHPGHTAVASEHLNLDPERSKNVPIFAPLSSADQNQTNLNCFTGDAAGDT